MSSTLTHATDIAFLSAAEQGRLIRERKLSPTELVQSCLARIERWDPVLRAYITVCADAALAAAREAEREIAAGRWRGPLHGLPFGVKDQINTRSQAAENRFLQRLCRIRHGRAGRPHRWHDRCNQQRRAARKRGQDARALRHIATTPHG